jgi:hypothetical protein
MNQLRRPLREEKRETSPSEALVSEDLEKFHSGAMEHDVRALAPIVTRKR